MSRALLPPRVIAPFADLRRRLRIVESLAGADFRRRWIVATLLGITSGALEAVAAVLFLVFVGEVADPTAFDRSSDGLLRQVVEGIAGVGTGVLATTLVLFYVVRGGVSILQMYLQSRAAEEEGARLAERVLTSYLALPLRMQRDVPSAQVTRDVNDLTQVIARQLFQPMLTVLAELVLVVAMAAVLFLAAPAITGVALVVLGTIVAAVLRLTQPRLARLGTDAQEALVENLKWVRQSIEGARDIKAYGAERLFVDGFRATRRRFIEAMYRSGTVASTPRIAIETTFVVFVVALVATVTALGETEGLLSTLALFAYVAFRLVPALNRIALAFSAMRFGGSLAADLAATLRRLEPMADPDPPRIRRPVEHSIELQDVSFRYGPHQVLSRLSLSLKCGEVVGLVGRSGEGKSTLLDILAGLLSPDEGRVLVDGHEVPSLRVAGVSTALVSQNAFVADESLEANVAFGLHPHEWDDKKIRAAISAANLDLLVAQRETGVSAAAGESGSALSGGQNQRLVLARALYRDADVTLVDEGTAALDDATERDVLAALVAGLRGRILVIVSHRRSALAVCDRVYELVGGTLHRPSHAP